MPSPLCDHDIYASNEMVLFQWLKKTFGEISARPLPARDLPSQTFVPEPAPVPEKPDLAANWWSGKVTSDLGPPGDNYDRLFEAAVARSRSFGLFDQTIKIVPGRVLNAGNIKLVDAALRQFVDKALGGDVRHMVGQCFTVCSHLEAALEGVCPLDPVLTVGSVYAYKGRMFGIDVGTLEAVIAQGAKTSSASLDLHAWLTFPTGEIIDPTLLTTVAVKGFNIGVKSGLRKLVHGHPRSVTKLRYEPQIVGSAIFSRLGMIRGVIEL